MIKLFALGVNARLMVSIAFAILLSGIITTIHLSDARDSWLVDSRMHEFSKQEQAKQALLCAEYQKTAKVLFERCVQEDVERDSKLPGGQDAQMKKAMRTLAGFTCKRGVEAKEEKVCDFILSKSPASWNDVRQNSVPIAIMSFLATLGIVFTLLTVAYLVVIEPHIGWRRLSLVIGGVVSLVIFGIGLFVIWFFLGHFNESQLATILLLAVAAFPFSILVVLSARRISTWVRVGFGHEPILNIVGKNASPTATIGAISMVDSEVTHSMSITEKPQGNLSQDQNESNRDAILAIPLASPLRRYWARNFDLWVFLVPVWLAMGGVLSLVVRDFPIWIQSPLAGILFGWLCVPGALFVEAVFVGIFGNTPMKALLGLQVFTVGGNELGFREYLSRQIGVYWYGLGTGFPLISLFTIIKQFTRLKQQRQTTYDAGRYNVRGRPLGWVHILVVLLVLLGLATAQSMLLEALKAR